MQKKEKQIGIRIFFLALFLGYFADITFFTHQHIVNGETIIHSHFTCSPNSSQSEQSPEHNHSSQAFHLISHLAIWTAILIFSIEVPISTWIHIFNQLARKRFDFPQTQLKSYHLRAPPFHIF